MPPITRYPSTTSTVNGTGLDGQWANPANIFADDGSNATSSFFNTVFVTQELNGAGFGYNLPSTAVIDGIKLEMEVPSSSRWDSFGGYMKLKKAGSLVGDNKAGTATVASNVYTYGSSTSLWGTTWTAAQINASNFGFGFQATVTSIPNDFAIAVDYVRITVYYHIPAADVPTRELFKVYNQDGLYIGNLPTPAEPLKIAQDINSLGSQITLKVPVSADTSMEATSIYTTEDGSANYTDESATNNYVTEGKIPIISPALNGADSLIKNGNTVQCWLYNYWYPTGKCMFIGRIRRWEADFGVSSDCVNVFLYSTGYDLDNYITRGAPFSYTNDQVQTTQDSFVAVNDYFGSGGGWRRFGQTFVQGVGINNIGAVSLMLNGIADVTVSVYSDIGVALVGSTTQAVSVATPTVVQFGMPQLLTASPGATYFIGVTVGSNQTIDLYYQSTSVYSSGTMYSSIYGGGSGGGAWGSLPGDLYFVTASGTGSTTATFTSKDPSTQMLAPIITDYNLRGGTQHWTAVSIDATGLSLTYTFSVQTVYEALQAILSLSPEGFYYYIDLGTQTIYFKNQSTTADYLLQKKVHINNLSLVSTTEGSVNTLLFTGGETSPSVNLYKSYADAQSISALGPLLDRKTDNRVTVSATADAIGNSEIAAKSGEMYQSTVTLVHTTKLDITLLTPGKVVGFRGFGTFVDQILTQIVHREWTAEYVTLTLGVLPKRLSTDYNQTTRQLIASQTQNNPSAPS